jgi:putative heme-binding domain-containing protein
MLTGMLVATGIAWAEPTEQQARDISNAEALLRLPDFDLAARPDLQSSLSRYLTKYVGTTRYFQLIRQFKLRERSDELLNLALSQPRSTAGSWAAETLNGFGHRSRLKEAVSDKDPQRGAAAVILLGETGDERTPDFLTRTILNTELATMVRVASAAALAKQREGDEDLLRLVTEKMLPADLNFAVGNLLHASDNSVVRAAASEYLPLPPVVGGTPLPPVSVLAAQSGNRDRGQKIFQIKGTCAACHTVAGEGKAVGPDLTEIGSKLSKEALYVSILDPNAGISHNYENYEILTQSGRIETGLLLSRTGDQIDIINAEGVARSFQVSDIDSIRQLTISLMPAGLQQTLTKEELVDLVEYLTSLKTKQ